MYEQGAKKNQREPSEPNVLKGQNLQSSTKNYFKKNLCFTHILLTNTAGVQCTEPKSCLAVTSVTILRKDTFPSTTYCWRS